jgi:hypothetical protein
MLKIAELDQQKRAEEKQASRDEDERLLADGKISPVELRRKNGFFSSLDLSEFKMIAIGGKPVEPRKMRRVKDNASER